MAPKDHPQCALSRIVGRRRAFVAATGGELVGQIEHETTGVRRTRLQGQFVFDHDLGGVADSGQDLRHGTSQPGQRPHLHLEREQLRGGDQIVQMDRQHPEIAFVDAHHIGNSLGDHVDVSRGSAIERADNAFLNAVHPDGVGHPVIVPDRLEEVIEPFLRQELTGAERGALARTLEVGRKTQAGGVIAQVVPDARHTARIIQRRRDGVTRLRLVVERAEDDVELRLPSQLLEALELAVLYLRRTPGAADGLLRIGDFQRFAHDVRVIAQTPRVLGGGETGIGHFRRGIYRRGLLDDIHQPLVQRGHSVRAALEGRQERGHRALYIHDNIRQVFPVTSVRSDCYSPVEISVTDKWHNNSDLRFLPCRRSRGLLLAPEHFAELPKRVLGALSYALHQDAFLIVFRTRFLGVTSSDNEFMRLVIL